MNNKQSSKIFIVLLVLLFSTVSVSALSLIAEFDNGKDTKSIMPGQSAGYYVLVAADQSLTKLNITGNLYDVTTGQRILLGTLFGESTAKTFFYPPEFFITPENYTNLPGKYVLTVTAQEWLNNGYTETKTTEIKLTVIGNRLPVADFIYSPQNISTITPVTFNSTSYDTDGYIVRLEWFVGAAKIGEGKDITYLFNRQGTYNVTLRVIDNAGGVATHSEIIVVSQGPITGYPIANFTYVPANPVAGDTIVFTSTAYDTDGVIVKEEWDLNNDGLFETTSHVTSRAFSQAGTYTVWLKVTDNDNLEAITSRTITVGQNTNLIPPVANFSYQAINPYMVVLTSTSYDVDGYITTTEWDLNSDGIYDASGIQLATTNLTRPGNYSVTLKVTDNDGLQSIITKIVTLNSLNNSNNSNIPPVANFTYVPGSNITTATNVRFTSTSYDVDGTIVSYLWYVNNVFVDGGANLSRIFYLPGTYNVTLEVRDDNNAYSFMSKQIIVVDAPAPNVAPVADFTYYPTNITTLSAVSFTSTSYDVDGTITSSSWFVDGVFAGSGNTLLRSFTSAGMHTITLTVMDDDGAQDSETKIILVSAVPLNQAPVADFVYSPSNPTAGDVVTFFSTSYDVDGTIVAYEWIVDGVSIVNTSNMMYALTQEKTYSVTLIVTDDEGASSSVTKLVTTGANLCAPDAVLRAHESVLINKIAQMDGALSKVGCNSTIAIYRLQIYTGNILLGEISSTNPYFSYNFTTYGAHRVVLTVYATNGLSDVDEKVVFVGRPAKGITKGAEDDLYVDYFDVVGSSYGVVELGDSFVVSATVSNDRDDDIDDLKITFAIPELGYELESENFDLDSGDTRSVSIHGYLDFTRAEVPPGEYYALIGVSDTDTIRVKYFPLIIK